MMHEHEHGPTRHPHDVWSRGVVIPAGGPGVGRGAHVRVLAVSSEPHEAPKTYALNLSPNLAPLLALPLYDVRVGIGEENYEWLNLPAPAAGAVYVVQAHNFTVDVHEGNLGAGTQVFCFAGPTEAVPTLTP
jgi:hypothetical protein